MCCADDGPTVAIGPDLEVPTDSEKVDAGGMLLVPGGVDPHTRPEPAPSALSGLARAPFRSGESAADIGFHVAATRWSGWRPVRCGRTSNAVPQQFADIGQVFQVKDSLRRGAHRIV